MGDCWFLGALAMCATRQDDLLYPLFVSAHPEIGMFQIRFFIDAAWRVVTVDDYVPVKETGSMIFGHCKNDDEYWVALVEKAFAKLNGNYENMGSGNFSEAMSNLTGEGSEAYPLTPEMAETDEFWRKLEYYVAEAFLMGCSIEGRGEHDNGRGLLMGHAYGIISCRTVRVAKRPVRLIQCFNPWGMKVLVQPNDCGFVSHSLLGRSGRGRGATGRPSGPPSSCGSWASRTRTTACSGSPTRTFSPTLTCSPSAASSPTTSEKV